MSAGRNIETCWISFYRLGKPYMFIGLQFKYLLIAGQNLDEN